MDVFGLQEEPGVLGEINIIYKTPGLRYRSSSSFSPKWQRDGVTPARLVFRSCPMIVLRWSLKVLCLLSTCRWHCRCYKLKPQPEGTMVKYICSPSHSFSNAYMSHTPVSSLTMHHIYIHYIKLATFAAYDVGY